MSRFLPFYLDGCSPWACQFSAVGPGKGSRGAENSVVAAPLASPGVTWERQPE